MNYKVYLFPILALSCLDAVKVNMHGSLNLGKDVVDILTYYMKPYSKDGRRSGLNDPEVLLLMIKSSYLCRDLNLCDGFLENFVNEYVTFQTRAMEAVFQTARHPNIADENLYSEENLKNILRRIRESLKYLNEKLTEDNQWIVWLELFKSISAIFQETAVDSASDKLMAVNEAEQLNKELSHKLIIATVIVEGRFENKLCSEFNICIKSFECTKALDVLLGSLLKMEDEKAKVFIRDFSEAMLGTSFYSKLNDLTANELQYILNDIAYTNELPMKKVFYTIHRAVRDRLKGIANSEYIAEGRDLQLLHGIMSDLDFAYVYRNVDPFHGFLNAFFEWKLSAAKLAPSIKKVLTDIADQLLLLPDNLQLKLFNEVKTFLEITVGPD